MALLQIAERGQSTAPHEHKLTAGIDLGTTNSLVASVRSGQPATIPDFGGEHLLPSAVRYLPDGVVVGRAAKEAVVSDPLNTITSAKRLIGRGVDEIKGLGVRATYEFVTGASAVPRIRTVAGEVTPIQISSEILKSQMSASQPRNLRMAPRASAPCPSSRSMAAQDLPRLSIAN